MPVDRETQSNYSDSGTENDIETEQTDEQDESINEPFNLEEFVCPICIDYLIDVVETPCRHRFCCHCLSQWVNINPQRKCPTCRSSMGLVARMPHLDDKITESLTRILDPIALSQREIVRTHRQSIDFPDDNNDNDNEEGGDSTNENDEALRDHPLPRSWTNQATDLIARIRETRRRVGDFQLHSTVANAHNFRRAQNIGCFPLIYRRQMWSRRPARLNGPSLFGTMTVPMREDLRRANVDLQEANVNEEDTARLSTYSASQLLSDYTYHLRSAESAHSRIKNEIRDFEYHNSRLDGLFQDFTSLNTHRVSQQRLTPPRNITQEDSRFSQGSQSDSINFQPLPMSTSLGFGSSSLPTLQRTASGISRNSTQLVSEVDDMLGISSERYDLMRQISLNDNIEYPIESFERLQEILLQPRVRNYQRDRGQANTQPGMHFSSSNETQTRPAPPPPRLFPLHDHEFDTMRPSFDIGAMNAGAPAAAGIDLEARSQRQTGTEVGGNENIAGVFNMHVNLRQNLHSHAINNQI